MRMAAEPPPEILVFSMLHLYLSQTLGEAEIGAWTTQEERAVAAAFTPLRRAEWLSWRAVVRRELGSPAVRFVYNECGAPSIEGSTLHLAVSHCQGSIAVVLSDTPCAVDIESLDRPFERLASRYLSPAEARLSDKPHWLALVWCAKETLYKFAGRRGLDLLHDLRIEEADFTAGTLVGSICGGDPVVMQSLFLDSRVVAWI